MEEIVNNSSKREKLIENGRIKARNYDWDEAASKTWEILREFL